MAESRLDRAFVRAALQLTAGPEVDKLLVISDRPLPPNELKRRPVRRKLVYAVTSEALRRHLAAEDQASVVIPPYDYDRVERIQVALVSARSAGLAKRGDVVLALTGVGKVMDTLVRLEIGSERATRASADSLGLPPEFSSQVVDALVHVAMEIGAQGYEGHPTGTILVVGDSTAVMEKSRQLNLNPFQGISEGERNALDPAIQDAIKTFAVLDGAFVIREDGVVLAAGRYLQTASKEVRVQMGLGARHTSAAAMTLETRAIAITVSQTSGTVRVFKAGEVVLELHQIARRM
ncbi:DNA integrity scanning protein DisA nucleotide-binding domain protein [Anaeromyxobacter paludicola]|uniref:DAC domain-containing protein n=1 Tax=Anaeromyxobacter paludicola TaxID=2918171 RepID=A0ABM7X5G2_9BACT|nr:diadenylate cyclase [Anaeromyxobacter paludicola]BDG07047.1 hypothetical protein AMPC_01600 [Anaeromyxobacter paludicola]